MFTRSAYLNQIHPFMDKPVIKVIVGMRRVGKSTILEQLRNYLTKVQKIRSANIVYINKESLDFDDLKTYLDLHKYVQKELAHAKGKRYIFIDEIQEIEDWEKAISSFLAEKLGDIIITGSNAQMLSSELATKLTGRYIEFPIWPLSFKEFLQFRGIKTPLKDYTEEFKLYLQFGGLPGIHSFKLDEEPEATASYLNSILNTILLKDIVRRYKIRDVTHLERITTFLLDNCGNIISAKSIADYFRSQRIKLSVDTVQSYLEYLCHARLAHRVKRFDIKGKRLLEFYDKFYLGDLGLRSAIPGINTGDWHGILENVVYLELLRRGYQVSIGGIDGLEIDFIAQKAQKRLYIQVAYLLDSKKAIQREFGNLQKINDNFPKLVLSMDTLNHGHEGIEHQNMIQFLLER